MAHKRGSSLVKIPWHQHEHAIKLALTECICLVSGTHFSVKVHGTANVVNPEQKNSSPSLLSLSKNKTKQKKATVVWTKEVQLTAFEDFWNQSACVLCAKSNKSDMAVAVDFT